MTNKPMEQFRGKKCLYLRGRENQNTAALEKAKVTRKTIIARPELQRCQFARDVCVGIRGEHFLKIIGERKKRWKCP